MALVLVLLLLTLVLKRGVLLFSAMVVHVLNMVAPQVYRPAAVIWFSLARLLGMIVSKVILSIRLLCRGDPGLIVAKSVPCRLSATEGLQGEEHSGHFSWSSKFD